MTTTTRKTRSARVANGTDAHWTAIAAIERTQERVVTVLDTVSQRLASLETKVGDAPTLVSVEKTERRVDEIEDRLTDAAKPNYQAMSFLLGGIIALGTLVSFGMNSKINGYYDNLTKQVETLAQHVSIVTTEFRDHTSNGHPTSVIAMIEANKHTIEGQINHNQRELDLLRENIQQSQRTIADQVIELQKRTGVLFNQGKPY